MCSAINRCLFLALLFLFPAAYVGAASSDPSLDQMAEAMSSEVAAVQKTVVEIAGGIAAILITFFVFKELARTDGPVQWGGLGARLLLCFLIPAVAWFVGAAYNGGIDSLAP